MMVPNWIRGESTPEKMGVTLDQMIDNIDHICQLSGNSSHVGIALTLMVHLEKNKHHMT